MIINHNHNHDHQNIITNLIYQPPCANCFDVMPYLMSLNQVCFLWNQVCFLWNQVCVLWNSSPHRNNQVFVNACELHRTRYNRTYSYQHFRPSVNVLTLPGEQSTQRRLVPFRPAGNSQKTRNVWLVLADNPARQLFRN